MVNQMQAYTDDLEFGEKRHPFEWDVRVRPILPGFDRPLKPNRKVGRTRHERKKAFNAKVLAHRPLGL